MTIPGYLRIDELRLAPGQEWIDAADCWRFARISSGAAYWLDTAKPRALSPGEMLVLAPAATTVVRASQLTEVILHGFNFAPDSLCGFFTLAERHYFETGAGHGSEAARFFPSTHPLTQQFAELIGRRKPGQEMLERAEALGLVAAFFTDGIRGHHLSCRRDSSVQSRFEQIISPMPDLELIRHAPEDLARLCGCSPRHFNRLFHLRFGEPPRVRQTELRLLHARQQLDTTEESIAQIALDSGYRSASLFSALFKKRFGFSPSAWRERSAPAPADRGKPSTELEAAPAPIEPEKPTEPT